MQGSHSFICFPKEALNLKTVFKNRETISFAEEGRLTKYVLGKTLPLPPWVKDTFPPTRNWYTYTGYNSLHHLEPEALYEDKTT